MKRTTHGILSLVIIAAAAVTATAAILASSVVFAALYVFGIFLSGLVLISSFCMKCPCRDTDCGHVIPGWLTRFFPPREQGPYTFVDKTGVVVPIVFLIVFPQYWLLSQPLYMYVFVALCLVAAADIQFFVCRGCTNCSCPFHQDESRKQ
jgi:hypothetical protein